MKRRNKPTVTFVWSNFGPYHIDRLEAVGAFISGYYRVVGIEIAGSSHSYAWDPTNDVEGIERITLFPNSSTASLSQWRTFIALIRSCWRVRTRHLFVCNYEQPSIFLIAFVLRILGRKSYVMFESKFDDSFRQIWREVLKVAAFLPYIGAIVGGTRSRDYLRWFGFRAGRVELGYDTVSIDRIRRLAAVPPAPGGAGFEKRHFTIVARLVPKKNIDMALEAYALYCDAMGDSARELHICGSGILESTLRAHAKTLGLSKVVFRGFVQAPEVARTLACTLVLILPSTQEQWGLVVNEAVAMGVPILCAFNPGARDLLVRTAINGFVFEAQNAEGLARLMCQLSGDQTEWRRLAQGSQSLAPFGDVKYFATAVARLVGLKDISEHSLTELNKVDTSSWRTAAG